MTDKLIKLNVRRMHHMEVPKLISRFIGDYEASKIKSTDEDFKRLFGRLKTNLEAFVALERPISRHKDKSALRQADTTRDHDIQALATSIRAFRLSKRADEAEAYSTLSMLMKSYREITKRNYEEESFAVEDLLSKLKKEPYRTCITTLNLTKLVTNLTETQTQFEALFDKTTTKNANQVKTAQINQAREALYAEYQHLCKYIENMVWVKGSDTYKKTLAVMNKSRQFYADILQRRRGKEKSAKVCEATTEEIQSGDETIEDGVDVLLSAEPAVKEEIVHDESETDAQAE